MRWRRGNIGVLARAVLPLALTLVACSPPDAEESPPPPTFEPAPGLVVMRDGDAEYLAHQVMVQRAAGVSEAAFQKAIAELGGRITNADSLTARQLGVMQVELPVSVVADVAIAKLTDAGIASAAERDYVVWVEGVPNDAYYSLLWGMESMHAPAAWEHTTGTNVVVAVTDTGVDRTHPDLAGNMWVNEAEIAGNGIDDDNNGYVDDVNGWDFAGGDADPSDGHGHGTHVSGTIGATGNNGIGVAGVNWHVKIMAVRICADYCLSSWSTEGTLYAARMSARVVNASYGGTHPPTSYARASIEALRDAGGVLVAAAGNSSVNNDVTPHYPSSYDVENVVSVAATTSSNAMASFSNYGAGSVDLGAPGEQIASTYPGGSYVYMSGTSMAAPHVTGAAAWFLAYNPSATYAEVKERLLATVDPTPALQGRTSTGGRLNLERMASDVNECLDGTHNCDGHARCHDTIDGFTCTCENGYAGDGTTCSDVDECSSGHNSCDPHAACDNYEGGYTCTCDVGFYGNGFSCVDVDECAADPCGDHAQCHNSPGGFTCSCAAGFSGDGLSCVDVDECAAGIDVCSPRATCSNTEGSYSCACESGFVGDGFSCVDIDECASASHGCNANAACNNLMGSYACICNVGFQGDGFQCSDVDECALGLDHCHPDADCTNTIGAWTCDCAPGYQGDGLSCDDVDECVDGLHSCDDEATCSNIAGSYDCHCNHGWAGDGFFCVDVDECEPSLNPCDAEASCTNVPGSVECTCNPGYRGDGLTCADADECALGTHHCDANAACTNTVGSHSCGCNAGFSGNGTSCTDIDECSLGLDDCGARAACTNESGGFACSCITGFAGDGHSCADIDECALGTDSCDANASCTNTVGGHSCSCDAGFSGNGTSCTDIDECATGTANCHPAATCSNTLGGFTCACAAGYSGNGLSCFDVDECAQGSDNCDARASCSNTPGGFSCACHPGYEGDGATCVDSNECASGTHDCDGNALCTNTDGSFGCACKSGFSGDGHACADVDECELGLSSCDPHASCINTAGSHRCECQSGFDGPGTQCSDIDECALGIDDCAAGAECSNTLGGFTCACAAGYSGNGASCVDVNECITGSHDCDAHASCFNVAGSFQCACQSGYSGDGRSCDANECALGTDDCDVNASCSDSDGGFSCSCKPGYVGNGRNCADVDECAAGIDACSANAQCHNTAGGYTCSCEAGYQGNGLSCADIDECAAGTHNCNAKERCSNTDGGYVCACRDGYAGPSCGDVNECALGLDHCHPNATCTNASGSYSCACDPGFTGDGFHCSAPGDDDECALGTDNCAPDADCIDIMGGFLCACRDGFSGDGVSCFDKDECALGTDDCHPSASCTNTPGGFTCTCGAGLSGDGTSCADVDECATGNACDAAATCSNRWGGFDCTCAAGWVGDGQSCTDIDECATGADACDPRATCTNTPGAYSCSCNAGYFGDGTTCSDEDECALGLAMCHDAASCANTDGSYHCACPPGWVGDGLVCDEDECANGSAACDAHASCANTLGSYSCSCEAGYAGDGLSCQDIDECALGIDGCDVHATCDNLPGGYSCSCNAGFDGDGLSCASEPTYVASIAAGGDHTCVVLDNGSVRCWGRNEYGQLGYGTTANVGDDEPADSYGNVVLGEPALQVTVGVAHSCALLQSGAVKCWGRNHHGQLGYGHTLPIGDNEAPASAGNVDLGGAAVQIVAGGEHTCALRDDGTVRCWGLGVHGQLGHGNTLSIGDDELPSAVGAVDLGSVTLQLSAGRDHTCALSTSGEVRCWGRAHLGQLGGGNTLDIGDDETPLQAGPVALGGAAVQVSAGWYHSCAVMLDGSARCWGYGYVGQLGYASIESIGDDEVPSTVAPAVIGADVVAIEAGVYHTCALLSGGGVRCWGLGDGGRLGYANVDNIGDDEHPATAGDVHIGDAATSIAVGFSHSCALLASGAARCWGNGSFGQLGTGTTQTIGDDEHPSGAQATMLATVDECALGTHGCNSHASCLNQPDGYDCSCDPGFEGDGVACADVDECAGGSHDCAAEASCSNTFGNFLCTCNAGYAGSGQQCSDVDECAAGIDTCDTDATCTNDVGAFSCACNAGFVGDGYECAPVGVHVTEVAAGESHTCAVLSTGAVRCWGYGRLGRLGYGNTTSVGSSTLPSDVGDVMVGGPVTQVALGSKHTCALLDTGAVRCWGSGASGALGYANTSDIGDDETPASAGDVDVGGSVVRLAAGREHTCALLDNGNVRCWGFGASGQLGHGNVVNIGDNELPSTAGDIALGGYAVDIAAGQHHSCALLEDGAVRCWGGAASGQLGYGNVATIGDNELPNSVGDVPLGGFAVQITAGDHHTCAVLTNGALRCWGAGLQGALGYGNTLAIGDNETPSSAGDVPVGGLVQQVVGGGSHTCALLQGGAVRCWGAGAIGQLGYGNTLRIGDDETPASAGDVPVGAPTLLLAAGGLHTCAMLSASLRCWGHGTYGQLGYGNTLAIGDDEPASAAGDISVVAP